MGRRFNIDPKPIVGESPYSCFSNNPILKSDIKGDSPVTKIIPVFIPEKTMPNIYKNLVKSLAKGQPSMITYDSDKSKAMARRREALKNTVPVPNFDRDEYPYASTKEGGAGADVNYVPSSENRMHGGMIGALVVANGMKTGDKFLMVPLPSTPEQQPSPRPIPVPALTTDKVMDKAVPVVVTVGAGYIIYKIAVAALTWECGGCGVLVTP